MPQPLADERVFVHEAGHALINVVLCGSPGLIDVTKAGNGRCQVQWDHTPDLTLTEDPEAWILMEMITSVAGIRAEYAIYGNIDIPGARADYKDLERALSQRRGFPRLHAFSKRHAEAIVDFLLKRFDCQFRACADALRVGTTTADRVWDAMHQADPAGALDHYRRFPVLELAKWMRRWAELRDEVGRDFAYAYADAPVPPERDYVELRAKHRRQQAQILARR